MATLVVVKLFKAEKLVVQVASSPKGHEVEVLSSDGPGQSFHKRVRYRQVRHGFHFGCLEYSKVSFPLMESEQRIIITADVFWVTGTTDCTVEHPTKRWPIRCARVYAETNHSTCAPIRDDEHAMDFENEGFVAKQMDTPQAGNGFLYLDRSENGNTGTSSIIDTDDNLASRQLRTWARTILI